MRRQWLQWKKRPQTELGDINPKTKMKLTGHWLPGTGQAGHYWDSGGRLTNAPTGGFLRALYPINFPLIQLLQSPWELDSPAFGAVRFWAMEGGWVSVLSYGGGHCS